MALAFASSFHLATGRVKPLTSSNATRKLYSQMKVSGSATVAVDRTQVSEFELENKKHDLLSTIQGTRRGQNTNADQRSIIEEALVCFPISFSRYLILDAHLMEWGGSE